VIQRRCSVSVDPDSMFDIQVKRIHEYKRQHLSALHIIALYQRLKTSPNLEIAPRTFIFGGKAAPGYRMAKLMIRLVTAIGDVINRDPAMRERMKVVFLPNFSVTNGQRVYPAADLSEQISTAGKEASGTGNMKFMMNGAVTIGTLDGANIEIREQVGADNFFLFGLSASEVAALRERGYRPQDCCERDTELREALDLLRSGFFSRGDTEIFRGLVEGLMQHDPYLVLADFRSYLECQASVGQTYAQAQVWTRAAILNCARSGLFSSDRAIRQYCEEIWRVQAVPARPLSEEVIGLKILQ
jgi:starch phosphorylase